VATNKFALNILAFVFAATDATRGIPNCLRWVVAGVFFVLDRGIEAGTPIELAKFSADIQRSKFSGPLSAS
jgi:hypothetical protein